MTFDLKQWRSNIGVTQEKAAELLGVHRVTYTNWEMAYILCLRRLQKLVPI